MADLAIPVRDRIQALTDPYECRVNLFLYDLGLNFVAGHEEFTRDGTTVGEIDGIFTFDHNLILVDVSNEADLQSDDIRGFYTKWSRPENIQLIHDRYGFPRHTVYRIFIYLRKDRPENLGSIADDLIGGNHLLYKDDFEMLEENFRIVGKYERNNLLARLDIKRRPLRTTPVKAILCYIGGKHVYLFSLNAKDLLDSSHITRRYKHEPGFQRAISEGRVTRMRRGIAAGLILAFPNSILVNVDRLLLPNPLPPEDCPTAVEIDLPTDYSYLKVIDGQHRLLSFTKLDEGIQEQHDLPIVAFEQLSPEEEADVFVVINTTQKRVDANLVLTLKADYVTDPTHRYWFDKVGVEVSKKLDKNSALRGKIYMGYADERRRDKWVPLRTLVSAMKSHHFIGRNALYQDNREDTDTPARKIREILRTLKDNGLLTAYDRFFLKSMGIRIIFRFTHLYERNHENGNIEIDFAQAIGCVAQAVDAEFITRLKGYYGEGGAKKAVDELCVKLKDRFPTFERFESDLRELA